MFPDRAANFFKDDWTQGTWARPWAEAMWTRVCQLAATPLHWKYCPWDQMPREQAMIFALRMKYGNDYKPPAATGTLFADMTDVNYFATPWAEQAYQDGLIPVLWDERRQAEDLSGDAGQPRAGRLHDRASKEPHYAGCLDCKRVPLPTSHFPHRPWT